MGDRCARDSGYRYSLLQTLAAPEISAIDIVRDIEGEYLGDDQ